jgi:hypothetical protein
MNPSNLPPTEWAPRAHAAPRDRLEPMERLPLMRGLCNWCGRRCPRGRSYCAPACRVAYNNLLTRQGKALVQALKVWRMCRGRKGTRGAGLLTLVSARVDILIAEDRARWKAARGQE